LADSSDFVINQNIGASSTFTAVDNWLYLDAAGQTSRQLVGDNAPFSANINAARGAQANVHSYTVSPFVFHEMADQSSVELRYRWSQTFVDDANTLFNPTGGNFLNDSRSQEAVASYDSGRAFDGIRFRTTVYGIETIDDGSDFFPIPFTYRQGSIFTDIQIPLTSKFALSGAAGYDKVETDDAAAIFFNEDELTGAFWRGGFTARPSRRAQIRLEYGRRYDDEFIDAAISAELSSRLFFVAGASRTFQTRAQAISGQFRASQRQTLEFADRLRANEELSPRGLIQAMNSFAGASGAGAQTIGLGVTNSAYAALNGAYRRTNLSLSGNYSDTDFGFRTIETYGVTLNANRQVSRRLTAFGELAWRRIDTSLDEATCIAEPRLFGVNPLDPLFDPVTDCAAIVSINGITNTVIASGGAAYRVYENVAAFLEYSHTERWSDNFLLEYGENTVTMGVSLDF
ncbi:MAG: porin family protein, partial [Hyphococcus sp.]